MQKILFKVTLLLSLSIIFSSCKKDPPVPPLKFYEGTGVLLPGQKGLFFVKGELKPIEIDLVRVTDDSRCPIEARCFWMGEVVAKIMVDGSSSFLIASTETTQKPVFFQGKHISIIDVKPSPRSLRKTIEQKDYQLTFKISN